ncbi:MAG TPA: choice-of-anchor Q domain-containing protein [Rhodanobacteraceae bacterium]|nr:choice-of-anchor Q domain-containing protein [Rhodanobacteraceae bacterium]
MRTISRGFGRAVVAAFLGLAQAAGATDGVVGPGNCDEDGFEAVLAAVDGSGGGTITFDCGTATIPFENYKEIAHEVTIDGGGRITFDGGNASAFFQVFFSADVTLKGLTLQHGIFSSAHALENFGTLTLDHVRMSANVSSEPAVVNSGTMVVVASTFSGNISSLNGGAINNAGTLLDVSSSTFEGNQAANGAAIYSVAPLTVANSTFNANAAGAGGGAIYQSDAGDASLVFVTAADNTASFGAGVYKDAGNFEHAMTVGNSIFSGNATGNCDGVITSSGYNLSDDTHCGAAFTGPGDVNDTPLPMQALGDHGGPTATMPPATGNPAIDHVPIGSCSPGVDQRGGGRPFGAACDSGAVEVGALADDVIFADGFDPID